MSLGGINPLDFAEIWDVTVTAGVTSPGLARMGTIPDRDYDWDIKKGKGTIGGTSTFVSGGPISFSVVYIAWLPEHFAAWETFLPLLQYDPTKKDSQAIDFYHPATADQGINSVITKKIGAWEETKPGQWQRTIDFGEYFPVPKKPAVGTPTGASGWKNSPPTVATTAAAGADDVVQKAWGP